MGEQKESILKGIGSSTGSRVGTKRESASAGFTHDKTTMQDKEDDILSILREMRADNQKRRQETRDLKLAVDDLKNNIQNTVRECVEHEVQEVIMPQVTLALEEARIARMEAAEANTIAQDDKQFTTDTVVSSSSRKSLVQ